MNASDPIHDDGLLNYSVDEERNGIYALLSLSAAGQGPEKLTSPGRQQQRVKRKRSEGLSSPPVKAETGSTYTRDVVEIRLPGWVVKTQQMLERLTSGQRRSGQEDVHGTPMSFITREFFYSDTDSAWYRDDGGMKRILENLGLGEAQVCLHKHEWWALLSLMGGKPRRLSETFLHESRIDLQHYRDDAQKVPFVVGQGVTAIHPMRQELHDGVILTVSKDACRVQFDKVDLGVHAVRTSDIGKKSDPVMVQTDGGVPCMMPPLHFFMQQYVHSTSNTTSPQKLETLPRIVNTHDERLNKMGEDGHLRQMVGMIQHVLHAVSQHQDAETIDRHVDTVFESCLHIIEDSKTTKRCLLQPRSGRDIHAVKKEYQSRAVECVQERLQNDLSDRIRDYIKVLMVLYRFPDIFDDMMDAVTQRRNLESQRLS